MSTAIISDDFTTFAGMTDSYHLLRGGYNRFSCFLQVVPVASTALSPEPRAKKPRVLRSCFQSCPDTAPPAHLPKMLESFRLSGTSREAGHQLLKQSSRFLGFGTLPNGTLTFGNVDMTPKPHIALHNPI